MPRSSVCAFLVAVALASIAAGPRDALVRARQLYNRQQYDAAIAAADEARRVPAWAMRADLVAARAYLERFRQHQTAADLAAGREALARVNPAGLPPAEHTELIVTLGEALYLEDRAGAAAEEFDLALGRLAVGETLSREQVLDWWAGAIDRQAHLGSESERKPLYARIVGKMEDELRSNPGSAVASYWLVAGARGRGDLERAWDAAVAGWVRASLAGGAAGALRTDLDAMVSKAIIPERARQMTPSGDPAPTVARLRADWDALKAMWPGP